MSNELALLELALEEWKRLDGLVRELFKKNLAERLLAPRVPSARLSGYPDRFKIKLRSIGYRLVYEVDDGCVVVLVVAVGKRDKNAVHKAAEKRSV